MSFQDIFYPESRFGGFSDIDGTIAFYTRINALLKPEDVLLDVGCGRGAYAEDKVPLRRELRIFKGKCQCVVGLDVDEAARSNPFLDEFNLIEGKQWPVPNEHVDICVADFVVEHLPNPNEFFGQCRRVLKVGGILCLRTPNRWNYVAVASRLIPNRHHAVVVNQVQDNRKETDVFPTLYKCNTRLALKRALRQHGFTSHVYGYEAEPSYLSFSLVTYAMGVVHQRLAPNALKATLFAFGRKNS